MARHKTPQQVQENLAPKRQWDRAVIGDLHPETLDPMPGALVWNKPDRKPWEALRDWLELSVSRPTAVHFLLAETNPETGKRVWSVDARVTIAPDPASKPPVVPGTQPQTEENEMDRSVLETVLARHLADVERAVQKGAEDVKAYIDRRIKELTELSGDGSDPMKMFEMMERFMGKNGGNGNGGQDVEAAMLGAFQRMGMMPGMMMPGMMPGYPPPQYPPHPPHYPQYPPPQPQYPPPQPQYPPPQPPPQPKPENK